MEPLRPRGTQPDRGERGRWLSAVLIVAGIGATTAGVYFWPVRLELPAAPERAVLTSRALSVVSTPLQPVSPTVIRGRRASAPRTPRPVPPAPAVEPVLSFAAAPPFPSSPAPVVTPSTRERVVEDDSTEPPLLASRRVAVPDVTPVLEAASSATNDSDSLHGIVELPAAAVTRAVSAAGRGIRTGLRATSAAVRAAF